MSAPTRVALFLPGLHGGGAERVMLRLAGAFADRGLAVDLVLAQACGPYLSEVAPNVRLVDLRAGRVLASLPHLTRYLRAERPTALLSTLEHANVVALGAVRLARVPVHLVVREANVFVPHEARGVRARALPLLMRRVYPRAGRVVAVSRSVAESLVRGLGLPREQVVTIYNPVLTPDLAERMGAPCPDPWLAPGQPPVILGAGRLCAQKDFGTLLRAFARVRAERPARLIIVGEGEERAALEDLARRLGVADDVRLPGFAPNVFAYMARAHAFALSSRYEGLPGVLIQALACGCAVVATDAPGGSHEVLDGGRLGALVRPGDDLALAQVLLRALRDPRPGPGAREAEWSRFSEETTVGQYLHELVGDPVAGRGA